MASLNMEGLDALIRDMEKMGHLSDQVAEAMLEAGAAEIRDCWRESAEKHDLRDTGEMIESIGFESQPTDLGTARYKDIYPMGKDSKGVRNAEKAFILHYGREGARKIRATYWVDDAEDLANQRVPDKLNKLWGDFLETGKVPSVTDTGGSAGGITTFQK